MRKDLAIDLREVARDAVAEQAAERDEDAEDDGDQERPHQEKRGANRRHAGCAIRWREASARSGNTSVLRGRAPPSLVPFPFPVSTRIGCAPTASALCRSLRLSPMIGTPLSSVWKGAAIPSSNPVLGLWQPQFSPAAAREKKTAS